MTNYTQFRGRCKELAEAAVAHDPSLRLVRGHYYCPIRNSNEQHWWCERAGGEIVDPSAKQFPSAGLGVYEPFSGIVECAECGKEMQEHEVRFESRYAFCSTACAMRFVGL